MKSYVTLHPPLKETKSSLILSGQLSDYSLLIVLYQIIVYLLGKRVAIQHVKYVFLDVMFSVTVVIHSLQVADRRMKV